MMDLSRPVLALWTKREVNINEYLDSLKERGPILGILALQVWSAKDSSYVKTMSFHMGESRKSPVDNIDRSYPGIASLDSINLAPLAKAANSCWLTLVLV